MDTSSAEIACQIFERYVLARLHANHDRARILVADIFQHGRISREYKYVDKTNIKL